MDPVSQLSPCYVRVEFAAGSLADDIETTLGSAIDDVAGAFESRPSFEVVSGLGARRGTAAVLVVATFAAGVAQGVAGNAVWQVIQGMGADPSSGVSVNGIQVDATSAEQALRRIEHILMENRCLRPTGE